MGNTQFTFHLLGSKTNPDPKYRGWWLLVDNAEVFEIVYHLKAEASGATLYSMFECCDLWYPLVGINGKEIQGIRHSTPKEFLANLSLGRHFEEREKEGKKGRIGLVETCDVLERTFCGPFEELYRKYGKLYVNEVGGFCMVQGMDKVNVLLDTKTSDELIFPTLEDKNEAEYKIYKWPQGKHWYAKVGGIEVKIGEQLKWNTYDAAKRACQKFAEQNGYTLKE